MRLRKARFQGSVLFAACLLFALLQAPAAQAGVAPRRPLAEVVSSTADAAPFRVSFWGASKSYLMLGASWLYTPSNATLTFFENADSSLTASIAGPGHLWAVTMFPPGSRRLTTGVYDSTDYDRQRIMPHARFRFARDAAAISYASARFEVRRLDRASDGRVRAFWMRFRIPDWTGTYADSGEIWYNADTSLFVRVPGDVALHAGTDAQVDARAFEATGAPVQFALLSAPTGTQLADHGNGTAAIDVPAASLPVGKHPVRLLCTSASGMSDTTIVQIRTPAPALYRESSSIGDQLCAGLSETRDELSAVFAVDRAVPYRAKATTWTPDHVWTLVFQGPTIDPLAPAMYPNARFGFGNSVPNGYAQLTVLLDGRYCPFFYTGSFDVRKLKLAPNGSLRSLWVEFQQNCSGATPFLGRLCWQADTSIYVRAASAVRAELGTALHLDAAAVDSRGLPIDYSASVPPAGAMIVDHHDGSAALEWPSGPPATGTYAVTWIATSSDGHADTIMTTITGVRSARVFLSSPASSGLGGTDAQLRYTAVDGDVTTAIYSDKSIATSYRGQGRPVDIRFAMPFDLPVREGVFDGARFVDRNERNEPALGLTLDVHNSCVIDSATFHIRHLERAPDGTVRSLWATFMQRCAGAPTVTTGELRVSADTSLYIEVPGEIDRTPGDAVSFAVRAVDTRGRNVVLSMFRSPAGAVYAPSSASSGQFTWAATDSVGAVSLIGFAAVSDDGKVDTVFTYVRTFARDRWRMSSASGDYIGQGLTYNLTGISGDIAGRISGSAMEVTWRGRRNDWTLQVAVPYSRVPAQGRYDSSVSTRTRTVAYSGIDLSTTGRSNTSDHGSFHIRKIAFDALGNPRSLWMIFDVSQTTGPGVTGEVVFGSPDTSYWTDAPADRFFDPGQSGDYAIQAHGTLAASPKWTLLSAPASATLVPGPDGLASVHWAGGLLAGDFPVSVRVEAAGVVDTATTWIHVSGPAYVQIDVDPSWYVTQGMHRRFTDRDGTFAFWRVASNNAISVTLASPVANARWDFSRLDQQRLMPGSYPITDWSPPYGNSPFGLYFVWNSRVLCSRNARFDIWDATYSATDSLLSFAATLTFNECNTSPPFKADFHFPGTSLPVPVSASLIDATWNGSSVHVSWMVSNHAEPGLRVERSQGNDEWTPVGAPAPAGQDRWEFVDADAKAGMRYGYRLMSASGHALLNDIAWIDVPAAMRLDLQRLGANPGGTPLAFAMSIPTPGAATLEVLDVAGRVQDRRMWTAIPAGRALVTLDGLSLEPGCYFARLSVPGASVTRSMVVIR